MKGRFRRAWMRQASLAGRRERVKFADARRASLVSGGRPCLNPPCQRSLPLLSLYYFPFFRHLPEQICQRQGPTGTRREASDLVIRYIRCRGRVGPATRRDGGEGAQRSATSHQPAPCHDAQRVCSQECHGQLGRSVDCYSMLWAGGLQW